MEKAPPPIPPKPAIQPKALSSLPQTSYAAPATEPTITKPFAAQQAQKTQPAINSPQNIKSSSLGSEGSTKSSDLVQTGNHKDISPTKLDSLDKPRNGRVG